MARPPVQDPTLQHEHNPLANINVEQQQHQELQDLRWEEGFKFELPEFHGGQSFHDEKSAMELLTWIVIVEETLEFKRVPLERCVPLIAMRFRGKAATWWAQLKASRARLGKPKILSWDKLKKKMRKVFLPFNYDQMMFKNFHNLQQGRLSVAEYYTKFFALLTCVDLQYSDQQLVARYIDGLQKRIQVEVESLNPPTVAQAHQQALTVEAQIQANINEALGSKMLILTSFVSTFIVCVVQEARL